MSSLEQRLGDLERSLHQTKKIVARVPQELLTEAGEDSSEEVVVDDNGFEMAFDPNSGNVDAMGAVIFANETDAGYFGRVLSDRTVRL